MDQSILVRAGVVLVALFVERGGGRAAPECAPAKRFSLTWSAESPGQSHDRKSHRGKEKMEEKGRNGGIVKVADDE